MNKPAVIKVIDELPHDLICARLAVSPRSIRLARERGVFPANWYLELKSLCEQQGVDCPDSVFNFKSPSSAPLSEAG